MPISVLSSEVIDQIAAGEVVERPSHLVKELVENSLDAGAKKISIDFSEGGRNIKVTDDGKGIASDELALALERFATSKISQTDDLWKLHTYGFRGEALASIAAVSRLTLTSKTENQEQASRLVSEFGKKSSVDSIGGVLGTKIHIKDLFENVPARLKFMKSAGGEHSQIKLTLKALALCRPDVEFQILEEGELLFLWSPCADHRARAEQVLGVRNLYSAQKSRDGVDVDVAFSSPSEVAKTSRQIWLFVQDRWIQDRSLQAAVIEAYRNLLMHGEYPIVAAWLKTSPENIDVNIHPTKSQVKFADPQAAFRALHSCLRESLEKAPWQQVKTSSILSPQKDFVGMTENLGFTGSTFSQIQYQQKSLNLDSSSDLARAMIGDERKVISSGQALGTWSRLQVLAQAHLTYLVCQTDDRLVFVDQHAAHERVLFERLMSSWRGGGKEVQEYLFPLALDLSQAQTEALLSQSSALSQLGVSIESLGPQTVGVRAAPASLKESALSEALQKMAFEIVESSGSFAIEKLIGDLCARLACHSAVRAGQSLGLDQMKNLLLEMDEFPLSGFCPHGRPVSVDYPIYELEKDFGRIV